MREIAKFVLNKEKGADRADMEAGKTGIASGTPGSQTLVVTGPPIGWKLGNTTVSYTHLTLPTNREV